MSAWMSDTGTRAFGALRRMHSKCPQTKWCQELPALPVTVTETAVVEAATSLFLSLQPGQTA